MAKNRPKPKLLLDSASLRRVLARLARQIGAANTPGNGLVLVGIQTGGVTLAKHLARRLERLWGHTVPLGALDVSMHRDDLHSQMAPVVHATSIPFDLADRAIVLVDDVLFSGRTTRAALDALHDLGRPSRIQLAVLIDRGHRQLPIQADFVGRKVKTTLADRVDVDLGEDETASQVTLCLRSA